MPVKPPALPGMEEALVPDEIRDVGAIVPKKDYTCEQLRAHHPGKYLLAVRAYFNKRRTAEAICDVLAISPNTMKAIIEQECAARGILPPREQIREKVQSAREIALAKTMELMKNEEEVARAGILGMTKVVVAMNSMLPQETEAEKPSTEGKEDSDEENYLDVIEAEIVDPNGFDSEKNHRARGIGIEPRASARVETHGNEPHAEPIRDCPTTETAPLPNGKDTIQQYIKHNEIQGDNDSVAKTVAKSRQNPPPEGTAAKPAQTPSEPIGGGGGSPPQETPGAKIKCIREEAYA